MARPNTNQSNSTILLPLKKITAFFLLISFILLNSTNNLLALSESASSSHGTSDVNPASIVDSLELSEELGFIHEKSISGQNSDKLVIYIQDAHGNYDAETNIAKLIRDLNDQYRIPLVLLEGGEGKLESLFFRSFPDEKLKLKIVDEYLQKGELQGAEVASMFSRENPINYYGIETQSLYNENKHAFLAALAKEKEVLNSLAETEKSLQKQIQNSNSQIVTFVNAFQSFRDEKINLLEYIKILHLLTATFEQYPELNKVHSAEYQEKNLKNEKVDIAFKQFVNEVKKKLSSLPLQKQKEINEKIQAVQTGKLDQGSFVKEIENVSLISIPEVLMPALRHAQNLSSIKGTKVFEELKRLEKEISETIAQSEKERKLVKEYYKFHLLKSLAKLELTHEEWNEINEFVIASSEGAKQSNDREIASSRVVLQPSPRNDVFASHVHFYELALKRDEALFQNLIKTMKMEKANVSIVITGGFHQEGIKERLKKSGISYVLVSPNIKKIGTKENYLNAMRDERSFMRYYTHSLWDALAIDFKEKVISSDPKLLKNWRDQIIQNAMMENRITEANQYTKYLDGSQLNSRGESINQLKVLLQKKLDIFFDGIKTMWEKGEFTQSGVQNVLNQMKTINVATIPPNLVLIPNQFLTPTPRTISSDLSKSELRRSAPRIIFEQLELLIDLIEMEAEDTDIVFNEVRINLNENFQSILHDDIEELGKFLKRSEDELIESHPIPSLIAISLLILQGMSNDAFSADELSKVFQKLEEVIRIYNNQKNKFKVKIGPLSVPVLMVFTLSAYFNDEETFLLISEQFKKLPIEYRYQTIALHLLLQGLHLAVYANDYDKADFPIIEDHLKTVFEGYSKTQDPSIKRMIERSVSVVLSIIFPILADPNQIILTTDDVFIDPKVRERLNHSLQNIKKMVEQHKNDIVVWTRHFIEEDEKSGTPLLMLQTPMSSELIAQSFLFSLDEILFDHSTAKFAQDMERLSEVANQAIIERDSSIDWDELELTARQRAHQLIDWLESGLGHFESEHAVRLQTRSEMRIHDFEVEKLIRRKRELNQALAEMKKVPVGVNSSFGDFDLTIDDGYLDGDPYLTQVLTPDLTSEIDQIEKELSNIEVALKKMDPTGARVRFVESYLRSELRQKNVLPLLESPVISEEMDWNEAFDQKSGKLYVQIGFTHGFELLKLAKENPHDRFIGIEADDFWIQEVAQNIQEKGISNIRLIHGYDYDVLSYQEPEIADGFLAVAYALQDEMFFNSEDPGKVQLGVSRLKEGGFLQITFFFAGPNPKSIRSHFPSEQFELSSDEVLPIELRSLATQKSTVTIRKKSRSELRAESDWVVGTIQEDDQTSLDEAFELLKLGGEPIQNIDFRSNQINFMRDPSGRMVGAHWFEWTKDSNDPTVGVIEAEIRSSGNLITFQGSTTTVGNELAKMFLQKMRTLGFKKIKFDNVTKAGKKLWQLHGGKVISERKTKSGMWYDMELDLTLKRSELRPAEEIYRSLKDIRQNNLKIEFSPKGIGQRYDLITIEQAELPRSHLEIRFTSKGRIVVKLFLLANKRNLTTIFTFDQNRTTIQNIVPNLEGDAGPILTWQHFNPFLSVELTSILGEYFPRLVVRDDFLQAFHQSDLYRYLIRYAPDSAGFLVSYNELNNWIPDQEFDFPLNDPIRQTSLVEENSETIARWMKSRIEAVLKNNRKSSTEELMQNIEHELDEIFDYFLVRLGQAHRRVDEEVKIQIEASQAAAVVSEQAGSALPDRTFGSLIIYVERVPYQVASWNSKLDGSALAINNVNESELEKLFLKFMKELRRSELRSSGPGDGDQFLFESEVGRPLRVEMNLKNVLTNEIKTFGFNSVRIEIDPNQKIFGEIWPDPETGRYFGIGQYYRRGLVERAWMYILNGLLDELYINAKEGRTGNAGEKVHFRAAQEKYYAVLEIKDDGEGIPIPVLKGKLDHWLKDREIHARFSTKPDAKDRGLGLPGIYQSAQDLGGLVRIQTKTRDDQNLKRVIHYEINLRPGARIRRLKSKVFESEEKAREKTGTVIQIRIPLSPRLKFNAVKAARSLVSYFQEYPDANRFPSHDQEAASLKLPQVTYSRHFEEVLSELQNQIKTEGLDQDVKKRIQEAIDFWNVRKDPVSAAVRIMIQVFKENQNRTRLLSAVELSRLMGVRFSTIYKRYPKIISQLRREIGQAGFNSELKKRIQNAIRLGKPGPRAAREDKPKPQVRSELRGVVMVRNMTHDEIMQVGIKYGGNHRNEFGISFTQSGKGNRHAYLDGGKDVDNITSSLADDLKHLFDEKSAQSFSFKPGLAGAKVMILGGGTDVHNEVYALLKSFPDIAEIHIVDADTRNLVFSNLDHQTKGSTRKIPPMYGYHVNLLEMPEELEGKIDLIFESRVFDTMFFSTPQLRNQAKSQLVKVLKPGGVYVSFGEYNRWVYSDDGFSGLEIVDSRKWLEEEERNYSRFAFFGIKPIIHSESDKMVGESLVKAMPASHLIKGKLNAGEIIEALKQEHQNRSELRTVREVVTIRLLRQLVGVQSDEAQAGAARYLKHSEAEFVEIHIPESADPSQTMSLIRDLVANPYFHFRIVGDSRGTIRNLEVEFGKLNGKRGTQVEFVSKKEANRLSRLRATNPATLTVTNIPSEVKSSESNFIFHSGLYANGSHIQFTDGVHFEQVIAAAVQYLADKTIEGIVPMNSIELRARDQSVFTQFELFIHALAIQVKSELLQSASA